MDQWLHPVIIVGVITGVGVTKAISSVPLFSQIFIIVKTHLKC